MSVRDFPIVVLLPAFIASCNSSRAPTDSVDVAAPSASASASAAPIVESKPLKPSTREGSSVTRAPQDDVLFLADEDHRAIRIVPFPVNENSVVSTIELPGRPAQIVASRDRVFVTIREMPEGGGGVLFFQRDGKVGLKETARVTIAADAWGIALSPDESFIAVTSAWAARVSIVDLTKAKVRSVVEVAREPRGITILPDGKRAYVSHLVGAGITRIGDVDGPSPDVKKFDLPAAFYRGRENTGAALGYTVVSSPRGERLFFPRHAFGMAIGDWFGAAAIDVWLPGTDAPIVPPATTMSSSLPPRRNTLRVVNQTGRSWDEEFDYTSGLEAGANTFIQPRAAVYRSTERTLIVASEGTDKLVEFDALMQDPTYGLVNTYQITQHENKFYDVATTCGAPSGITLSANEQTAYVYCRSTDDLAVVRLKGRKVGGITAPPMTVRLVERKNTPEDESFQLGRALYFNATDGVTSGLLSCAGCHPDGRDDGHVWHETHFKSDSFQEDFVNFMSGVDSFDAIRDRATMSMGYGCSGPVAFEILDVTKDEYEWVNGMGFPRQTPMLAGRVAAPGPYGWHGESEDLTKRLVDGFGLHRWRLGEGTLDNRRARAGHLAKFVREGLVPPEATKRELNDEEKKGKAIFESEKAQCARCHVPATGFTDRVPIPVGEPPAIKGFAPEKNIAYKTPSLMYVRGTAPYFHDGRYESLLALVEKNPDTMGKTMHLTAEEKKALVAYLETL